jgi:hypothetical protein
LESTNEGTIEDEEIAVQIFDHQSQRNGQGEIAFAITDSALAIAIAYSISITISHFT